MTTYNTGNPLGSTAAKDLFDNAQNLDYLLLGPLDYYPDRLGVQRISYRGIENQASTALINTGFEEIGDYDADGPLTIERRSQVFTKDGQFYSASASLVLPYTTVNNWAVDAPKFVNRGDFVLRQDLAEETGSTLIGAVDAEGNPSTVQIELIKNKSDFILVNSVAEARLVPASFKGVIATVGYYAGSTSGAAMYGTDLSDTSSADNSFTVLVSAGNVRRKIIYTDKLTVTQAGAKGDFSYGTNTGTDDAAALNRAHSLTPRGVTVFYPLGLYYTTQTVNMFGGSNVEFQSRATTTVGARCAIIGAVALDGVVHCQLGDVTLSSEYRDMVVSRATGAWLSSSRGLICSGVDQQIFENCASFNHGICVHVNGQLNPSFSRLNTWNCSGSHLKISNTVEPRFENCRFGRNGGADMLASNYVIIDGAGGIQVDTVDFVQCQFNQSGAQVLSAIYVLNYNNPNGIINFTNCHFEMWQSAMLAIDATVVRLQRMKFIGCTLTSSGGTQIIGGSPVGKLDDFLMMGCTMAGTLTIDNQPGVKISNCSLEGNMIINDSSCIAMGNRVYGTVTLSGTTGKLIAQGNNADSYADTFTGNRAAILGNI